MTRIGIFGWGIVAPRSSNIEAFRRNLGKGESWLSPFNGYGPDNFLVGWPDFAFEEYEPWIRDRFSPTRFVKLNEKMDASTKYAIGAFIQSLEQNPGIEEVLRELGGAAHVYIGTGLGPLPVIEAQSLNLYRAQRRWNRFWSEPERNDALRRYLSDPSSCPEAPPDPALIEDPEQKEEAHERWWRFWAERSSQLGEYLEDVRRIEGVDVKGEVDKGKMSVIMHKRRHHARLQEKWGSPDPPWNSVSADLIWNLQNTPAAQVSMMGRITGMTFAPVAACSTFGVALRLAMDSIRSGQAKAVVVGATDPPPHPLSVGAFYSAKVIAADAEVSKPLSGLRGTHISGGAMLWIVGDYRFMAARGYKPLGLEPLSVGVTSDADHIITPSVEGPTQAIRDAIQGANLPASQISSWDLHATATPGDYLEIQNLRRVLSDSVMVTARKGTFGHGMSAGGGWELTAQYLGLQDQTIYPTPLSKEDLNEEISRVHDRFTFDKPCRMAGGAAGKLSMGIGGINACVISRPWLDGALE